MAFSLQYIPAPSVETLDISPDPIEIAVDDTQQLVCTATFNIESPTPSSLDFTLGVIWSSSDEDVATVSPEGLVTGVGAGSCTVTAYLGSVDVDNVLTETTDTVDVTVS